MKLMPLSTAERIASSRVSSELSSQLAPPIPYVPRAISETTISVLPNFA